MTSALEVLGYGVLFGAGFAIGSFAVFTISGLLVSRLFGEGDWR